MLLSCVLVLTTSFLEVTLGFIWSWCYNAQERVWEREGNFETSPRLSHDGCLTPKSSQEVCKMFLWWFCSHFFPCFFSSSNPSEMNERTFGAARPTTSHPRLRREGGVMEMKCRETVCCRDAQQSHRGDMNPSHPTATLCCRSLSGSPDDSAAVCSSYITENDQITESCLSVTVA